MQRMCTLTCLKPVSTLEKTLLLEGLTLSLSLNSNVMVPYQTPITAEEDSVIFVT